MATDFYQAWLDASAANQRDLARAPVLSRAADRTWIETVHDFRTATVIGAAAGFATQGTSVTIADVPPHHHTGRHRHGEEAIFVLEGSGFVEADGRRYDIKEGSTIQVPFMAEHRIYNTGDDVLRYVSATSIDLDLFVRLGRLEQLEPKGEDGAGVEDRFPSDGTQVDPQGRRVVLHLEDAPDAAVLRAKARAEASGGSPDQAPAKTSHGKPHHHGSIKVLMGGDESTGRRENGFTIQSAAMTHVFEDLPHTSSHLHSHTEAVLFVLEGEGYSEVDGGRYDWRPGDAVHVPPRMTRHEHFNPSETRTRTLRIEFGIRFVYERQWGGFHKVEHREEVMARP